MLRYIPSTALSAASVGLALAGSPDVAGLAIMIAGIVGIIAVVSP